MEFTEFAQLLHPIIGGASSTHAFVKTLFDAIVTDDGRSVLEEVKEDTYKAYFNGNTGISRIAKKISPYIEPEEFVEFCDRLPTACATVSVRICRRSIHTMQANFWPHCFKRLSKTPPRSKGKAPPKGRDRRSRLGKRKSKK